MSNIVTALAIAAQLAEQLHKITEVVSRAQREGRDITLAELDDSRTKAKTAIQKLKEMIAGK